MNDRVVGGRGAGAGAFGASGWLALLPALAFSTVVYRPLLNNYFTGDDFLNLYRIVNMRLGEYLFTPHGGHTLPLRNLLFYLTAELAGPFPAPFFWSALITHLLNVTLLFVVIRRLTSSPLLAGFGALLWGTCPIHEGTLGWYSVFGQVVAATAMLVILALLARASAENRAPNRAVLALCYALSLLATMSFGVGLGIAMALPLVVAWLTPAARDPHRWGPPLRSLWVVVPASYLGFFWLHGLLYDEGLETPMTLLKYAGQLWQAWVPGVFYLVAYGLLRELTSFAFNPVWFTLEVAAVTIGTLVLWGGWAVWRGPSAVRRTLAACTLLTVGCYGVIAAGRAVFFEGYTGAFMAVQQRYHYAALAPLTVMLCVLMRRTCPPGRPRRSISITAFAVVVCVITVLYADLGPQIDNYRPARAEVDRVLTEIHVQAEAARPGAPVYIVNRAFSGFFVSPPPDFPGWAAIFAIFNDTPVVAGHRVFFTDHRPEVVAATRKGRRTAGLVIPVHERPTRARPQARPTSGPTGGTRSVGSDPATGEETPGSPDGAGAPDQAGTR